MLKDDDEQPLQKSVIRDDEIGHDGEEGIRRIGDDDHHD